MSSYVRRNKHLSTKLINHHRYKFLRSYGTKQDAADEASRWNREPNVSAKVTHEGGVVWTVWVSDKSKWRRRP